jgi:hypothetical protein
VKVSSAFYGVALFLASTGLLLAHSAQFSEDGRYLIAGYRAVRLWETETGRLACGIEAETLGRDLLTGVGVSRDGSRFAIGTDGGKILLFDRVGCVKRGELQGPSGQVDFLVFSPDGKHLYAASAFAQWLYGSIPMLYEFRGISAHRSRKPKTFTSRRMAPLLRWSALRERLFRYGIPLPEKVSGSILPPVALRPALDSDPIAPCW